MQLLVHTKTTTKPKSKQPYPKATKYILCFKDTSRRVYRSNHLPEYAFVVYKGKRRYFKYDVLPLNHTEIILNTEPN